MSIAYVTLSIYDFSPNISIFQHVSNILTYCIRHRVLRQNNKNREELLPSGVGEGGKMCRRRGKMNDVAF